MSCSPAPRPPVTPWPRPCRTTCGRTTPATEARTLGDPFRGALHLHDGPLSITRIMSLQLPNPVLAYVSACDTSRGGTSIPDEGITLASALQIAGYQHVVATLWQINDVTATKSLNASMTR